MNETTDELKAAYEAVVYQGSAQPRAHPDRLAVAAAMQGIAFPPVDRCRVLDIGCSTGSKLIPLAEQLPASEFLGIDLSPRQIEVGTSLIRELELTNIRLLCQDLMDFPPDAGKFDYIIAHGFYSWVPDDVRHRLLDVCRNHLSPHGIAYISYNIYPGCRLREVVRDLMLFHTRSDDPQQRIKNGREILQFVTDHTHAAPHYRAMLQIFNDEVRNSPDWYLAHDHMSLFNEPLYFWQFISEIRAAGLEYIGDTDDWPDFRYLAQPPLRSKLEKISADRIEREQYIDFLTDRNFRCSAICLAEVAAANSASPTGRFKSLYISGNLPDSPAAPDARGFPVFQFGSDLKINVSSPRAIAVLRHLRRIWPVAASYEELLAVMASQSADQSDSQPQILELDTLLETCHGLRLLKLSPRSTKNIAIKPPPRPRATAYARWQAAHNLPVISLLHEPVNLDQTCRDILVLLDGTRDIPAIVEALLQHASPETRAILAAKAPSELQAMIQLTLPSLAASCLLQSDASQT